MIENKLIHYETRREFEQEKPNIGDTSVAFISEDRTIYTHGVEYNCNAVLKKIDEVDRDINTLIRQKEQELQDLINQLNDQLEQLYQADVAETLRRLQEAEDRLADVRNRLSQLAEDQADAGIDINKLKGNITALTLYWDTAQQTFTEIQQTLDAHEGTISTIGQHVDTVDNTINDYKREVNLKLGTIQELIEHLDVTDQVRTVIGTEINAQDGLFRQFAKTTDIVNIDGETINNAVEQTLNSMDPSWSTLVSSVTENTTNVTGLKATVNRHESTLSEFASWKNSTSESISALQQWAGPNGANFTITAAKINRALADDANNTKSIAATIFGWANDEGSGLQLNGDKINFDAATLKFISDNIVIDGSKITLPDNFTVNAETLHIPAANVDGLNSVITNSIGTSTIDVALVANIDTVIANQIRSTSIEANSLTATSGTSSVNINGNGITVKPNSTTTAFNVNKNGSGSLANGHITWDTNGNLVITGASVSDSDVDVDIDGTTIQIPAGNVTGLEALISNKINAATIDVSQVANINNAIVSRLTATNGNAFVDVSSSGITIDPGTPGYFGALISSNGSGYLANQNISWDNRGNATLKNITVLNATITGSTVSGSVTANSLTATTGNTSVTIDNTGITIKPNSSTISALILSDGTGKFANGNIYWDANGIVYIKGAVIDGTTVVIDDGEGRQNIDDRYKKNTEEVHNIRVIINYSAEHNTPTDGNIYLIPDCEIYIDGMLQSTSDVNINTSNTIKTTGTYTDSSILDGSAGSNFIQDVREKATARFAKQWAYEMVSEIPGWYSSSKNTISVSYNFTGVYFKNTEPTSTATNLYSDALTYLTGYTYSGNVENFILA